jgi:hypothetical protein
MKEQAFTYVQHDNGLWRVLYYGKPIGIGLTVKEEIEAETIAAHLNRINDETHGRGYDEGFTHAERARWRI